MKAKRLDKILGRNEPTLESFRDRLGAVVYVQLRDQVTDVRLDRLFADAEQVGDRQLELVRPSCLPFPTNSSFPVLPRRRMAPWEFGFLGGPTQAVHHAIDESRFGHVLIRVLDAPASGGLRCQSLCVDFFSAILTFLHAVASCWRYLLAALAAGL
jgi:hypothetical protein